MAMKFGFEIFGFKVMGLKHPGISSIEALFDHPIGLRGRLSMPFAASAINDGLTSTKGRCSRHWQQTVNSENH